MDTISLARLLSVALALVACSGDPPTSDDVPTCPAGEIFAQNLCRPTCNRSSDCGDLAFCSEGACFVCPESGCPDDCTGDPARDRDGDGICNHLDNCADETNAGQEDADTDGTGDACDGCVQDPDDDGDGDGICGDIDNCPALANTSQTDTDGDDVGDGCDPCPADAGPDPDGDDVCSAVDDCPGVSDPEQIDRDSDGLGDPCDLCPDLATNDSDGDGVCDDVDACPDDPTRADTWCRYVLLPDLGPADYYEARSFSGISAVVATTDELGGEVQAVTVRDPSDLHVLPIANQAELEYEDDPFASSHPRVIPFIGSDGRVAVVTGDGVMLSDGERDEAVDTDFLPTVKRGPGDEAFILGHGEYSDFHPSGLAVARGFDVTWLIDEHMADLQLATVDDFTHVKVFDGQSMHYYLWRQGTFLAVASPTGSFSVGASAYLDMCSPDGTQRTLVLVEASVRLLTLSTESCQGPINGLEPGFESLVVTSWEPGGDRITYYDQDLEVVADYPPGTLDGDVLDGFATSARSYVMTEAGAADPDGIDLYWSDAAGLHPLQADVHLASPFASSRGDRAVLTGKGTAPDLVAMEVVGTGAPIVTTIGTGAYASWAFIDTSGFSWISIAASVGPTTRDLVRLKDGVADTLIDDDFQKLVVTNDGAALVFADQLYVARDGLLSAGTPFTATTYVDTISQWNDAGGGQWFVAYDGAPPYKFFRYADDAVTTFDHETDAYHFAFKAPNGNPWMAVEVGGGFEIIRFSADPEVVQSFPDADSIERFWVADQALFFAVHQTDGVDLYRVDGDELELVLDSQATIEEVPTDIVDPYQRIILEVHGADGSLQYCPVEWDGECIVVALEAPVPVSNATLGHDGSFAVVVRDAQDHVFLVQERL